MLMGKVGVEPPLYYVERSGVAKAATHLPEAVAPGLTMFAGIGEGEALFVRIVDQDGAILHQWDLDWWSIWPDAEHLPVEKMPKSPPGTLIHGMVLMEDGDLVFNYETLGMVRIDAAGEVVWRLPYQTHHSMFRADDGNLWVPGQKTHREAHSKWPLYEPPFDEFTILEVSPDGAILHEFSLFDLLVEKGWQGLLYLRPPKGDTLHLNDVEIFSSHMRAGFFQPGDVMVSLREINSVIVFAAGSLDLKYLSIGRVVHQHDPDFVDSDTLLIFDNNDTGPRKKGAHSRIVRESVPSGEVEVVFQGTEDLPFYTEFLGRMQLLSNGNMLLLEALHGRVLEVTPSGKLAWELNNVISESRVGLISDVVRLPREIAPALLESFGQEAAKRPAARLPLP